MSASSRKFTIALTGAAGLLGSGVIRQALPAGHKIVALDRLPAPSPQSSAGPGGSDVPPNSEIAPEDRAFTLEAIKKHVGQYTYHQADLLDFAAVKEIVKREGCDAVAHLAAVYKAHDIDGVHLPGGWTDQVSIWKRGQRSGVLGA